MTPAEHYAEAERLLDELAGDHPADWATCVATAALAHATLATVRSSAVPQAPSTARCDEAAVSGERCTLAPNHNDEHRMGPA